MNTFTIVLIVLVALLVIGWVVTFSRSSVGRSARGRRWSDQGRGEYHQQGVDPPGGL